MRSESEAKNLTGRDINWAKNGINIVDPDTGLTPLMLAAVQGKQPIAAVLLERGADLEFTESIKGRTALHIAARYGQVAVLDELLKRDARVNTVDKFKKTPLMHAAKGGYSDCVSSLLSRGAGVNICDENGFTPLHYAARFGHYQVIQVLLSSGAAIELRDDMDGKTALHWAAQYGRKETVIVLLDHGAKINRRSAREKLTALMLASREGFKSIVSTLIQRKADANMVDLYGWTALHFAASWGRRDTAHILIVEGLANINARDVGKDNSGGITPLIVASKGGHIEVMKVLLHYGADINKPEVIEHHPPLACAAALGLSDVVQCLIDYGADINLQNEMTGTTALMMAAAAGRRGALIVLLNHLADLNMLDKKGRTALEHATARGFRDILLSAIVHISPAAKANLVPWLELAVPGMTRDAMYGGPSVFLTSALYRRTGLFYGLYQLTGDCDVYLIYCLVMIAATCNQALRRQPQERPTLLRILREIDQMLATCVSAQGMCVDSTFTDAFVVGRVPCAALGPYDVRYFASAFVTGPLALYIEQDLSALLDTPELRDKIDATFLSCTREVGTVVDGHGDSCGPLLRLRYCPWAMLVLEGLGQLVFLGLVAAYCLHAPGAADRFDGAAAHPTATLSGLECALAAMVVALCLYEAGQLEEKRWQVSPSVVFDFHALSAHRWARVRGHFVENAWKVLDAVTLALALGWLGLRLAALQAGRAGGGGGGGGGDARANELYAVAAQLLVLTFPPAAVGLLRYPAAFHDPLAVELLTLFAVLKDLAVFAMLFGAVGLGFGLALHAIFRSDVADFRTPLSTLRTLFNAVLRVHDDSLFDDSANRSTGLVVGAVFLLLALVVLLNGIVGSVVANFARHRAESARRWQLVKCRYVQQFVVVLEKSPLCMLPAPLNLLPALCYGPHVYLAWRARLALERRTARSLAGTVSDATLAALMLGPAAVVEYVRVHVLAEGVGAIVRLYYVLWAPLGVLYCALCLLYKLTQDGAVEVILKSRLSDGRLRVRYAQARDFYEAQTLSRFEDQRLHKDLRSFASAKFYQDEDYARFAARGATSGDSAGGGSAGGERGFAHIHSNAAALAHERDGHISLWKSILRAVHGVVRKRSEDVVGRNIRIAPMGAYLQLAHVQEVDDVRPPELRHERAKPGGLPEDDDGRGSLRPEPSLPSLRGEDPATPFGGGGEVEGGYDALAVLPGTNSLAYASQYDNMRLAGIPPQEPQGPGASSKPGIWWVGADPHTPHKRRFHNTSSAKSNAVAVPGTRLAMSPYQPGVLSAQHWQELAAEHEPTNAHVSASLRGMPSLAHSRSRGASVSAIPPPRSAAEGEDGPPSQDMDIPTNTEGYAQAADSFYFPAQRFAPIFQLHERKAIFAPVLPDIFRDDFTHAIEVAENNVRTLETRLRQVELLQQTQLALLQQLVGAVFQPASSLHYHEEM